jgi:hypothetical protein
MDFNRASNSRGGALWIGAVCRGCYFTSIDKKGRLLSRVYFINTRRFLVPFTCLVIAYFAPGCLMSMVQCTIICILLHPGVRYKVLITGLLRDPIISPSPAECLFMDFMDSMLQRTRMSRSHSTSPAKQKFPTNP